MNKLTDELEKLIINKAVNDMLLKRLYKIANKISSCHRQGLKISDDDWAKLSDTVKIVEALSDDEFKKFLRRKA